MNGLSSKEVLKSRELHGSNKLPEPKLNKWYDFAKEALTEKITMILIAIAVLQLFLGIFGVMDLSDPIMILVVLAIVTCIAVKTGLGVQKSAAEDLQKLKEEKEQVLFQMEADSQIIELHQSMDNLNTNNESDRMLERVREGARKTRERAEGSRIAYDSSAQANERRLANSERERNARQILDDMKRQRGNK